MHFLTHYCTSGVENWNGLTVSVLKMMSCQPHIFNSIPSFELIRGLHCDAVLTQNSNGVIGAMITHGDKTHLIRDARNVHGTVYQCSRCDVTMCGRCYNISHSCWVYNLKWIYLKKFFSFVNLIVNIIISF